MAQSVPDLAPAREADKQLQKLCAEKHAVAVFGIQGKKSEDRDGDGARHVPQYDASRKAQAGDRDDNVLDIVAARSLAASAPARSRPIGVGL